MTQEQIEQFLINYSSGEGVASSLRSVDVDVQEFRDELAVNRAFKSQYNSIKRSLRDNAMAVIYSTMLDRDADPQLKVQSAIAYIRLMGEEETGRLRRRAVRRQMVDQERSGKGSNDPDFRLLDNEEFDEYKLLHEKLLNGSLDADEALRYTQLMSVAMAMPRAIVDYTRE